MQITAWEPPYQVAVRHIGELVRGEARFELLDLPAGRCRVTWSELIDLPLGAFGRVGWIAAVPPVRAALRVSLWRLARMFE